MNGDAYGTYQPGAYPVQPAPPFQPPRSRSRSRVVLIAVASVLFVGAAVLAGLYVAADSDHEAAVAALAAERSVLADVRADAAAAREEKSAAETANADLEAAKAGLAACYDATQHYLWDGLADAERNAALDAMWDVCQ